jgi:hypothetical protein
LGSPLGLMMMLVHCADSVASTRSRIDTPTNLNARLVASRPCAARARPRAPGQG